MPTGERIVVTVGRADDGARLDRWLATVAGVGTRSQAKLLVDADRVRVDGTARKASFAVRAGMRVAIDLPATPSTAVEPEDLPLAILHEDAHLLAIDKPAGMVVHPAPGARLGTVVNAVLHRLGALDGVGARERPGIVHRLDKDTSGVLLVARTAAALEALARQFRARTVEKCYLALVHGTMRGESGIVDAPVGRDPRERKRMSVHSRRRRPAVTRWRVRERFPGATLLTIAPETGRTHQIRVHLAAIKHPCCGDPLYGADPALARKLGLDRQWLHAVGLGFEHPGTGAYVHFESEYPEDLQRALDTVATL